MDVRHNMWTTRGKHMLSHPRLLILLLSLFRFGTPAKPATRVGRWCRNRRWRLWAVCSPAVEPASAFGLIKGLFDAVRGVFGVVTPKLELTYEPGKSPYFETDEWTAWVSGSADADGNVITTSVSSPRRW